MLPVDKITNKAAPQTPAKQAAEKAPSAQGAKAPAPPAAARSLSTLVSASGLPADKLSASIISFARFFSLPIKPDLMADIRRQAFSSAAQQSAAQPAAESIPPEPAKTEAAARNKEALSLAAAAAEGKGVELKDRALENYAQSIDPEWDERQEADGQQRQKRGKNGNEREEGEGKKAAPVSAAAVKEAALDAAEKDPLLEILNRLPGKDGQRWITLPFAFDENGRQYRVSLRILPPDYMALDICPGGDKKQRSLFVIESANDKPCRLAVYLQHEISSGEQSSLVGELSGSLGIKPERISVKMSEDAFPFEAGYGEEQLRFVDEAV
jgi:hypothetical protein